MAWGRCSRLHRHGGYPPRSYAIHHKVSFESTRPICTFIANGQYDIENIGGGAYEDMDIIGVRTEDPQFYYGISSIYANISGVATLPDIQLGRNNSRNCGQEPTSRQPTTTTGSTASQLLGQQGERSLRAGQRPARRRWKCRVDRDSLYSRVRSSGKIDMSTSNFQRLPNGGANATSPGTITLQNQMAQGGTIGPNPTLNFPFYSIDFGNSNLAEVYMAEGPQKGGLYNNNGTSVSNITGFSWPSSSAGLWFANTPVQVGNANAYVLFDRTSSNTVFTNNFRAQLTLSRTAVNISSGTNLQIDSMSATGQVASTLATGTAPFSITSTTPVANLTAVPTTYDHSGTQQTATHLVGIAARLARTAR